MPPRNVCSNYFCMKYVPCKIVEGIRTRSFVSMWLLMQDIKVTSILRTSCLSHHIGTVIV